MSQQYKIGTTATSIRHENGLTIVRYHDTDVVTFSESKVLLNTGGWETATTKLRMNQASAQFGLGYRVIQRAREWFVEISGMVVPFDTRLEFGR